MNVEYLFAVARAIRSDIEKTRSIELLERLARLSTPRGETDPFGLRRHLRAVESRAKEIVETREELLGGLGEAGSNNFSPAWKQVATQLQFDGLLGKPLGSRIQEIFNKYETAIQEAVHREISALSAELSARSKAVVALTESLEQLGFSSDGLPGGTCELGVQVPRGYVKNRLDEFASELGELHATLGVFEELATGQRGSWTLRSIASSDYTVYLDAVPAVAALVAVTIERIVSLYKQLLEIRKLHGELAMTGVPQERTQGIQEYANNFMEAKVGEAASELIEKYCVVDDGARRHELEVEMRSTMKRLAHRFDRGFKISIRTSEEAIPESKDSKAVAGHLALIRASESLMNLPDVGKTPILSLEASGKRKT